MPYPSSSPQQTATPSVDSPNQPSATQIPLSNDEGLRLLELELRRPEYVSISRCVRMGRLAYWDHSLHRCALPGWAFGSLVLALVSAFSAWNHVREEPDASGSYHVSQDRQSLRER